jgi:ABC-type Zn2+ transport system substrate-binding protein/surface adhesin
MGMIKKLIASGIAAKVIQEARKPENQAKIKQAIADFQAKRANQAGRAGTR